MGFDIVPYLVEGFGTFSLVLIGCGTAAMMTSANDLAMFIVGLAFALILLILLVTIGIISGSNCNPVVSLALAFNQQISYFRMLGYWLAQLIGALIAGAVLYYIFGSGSTLGSSIGSLTYTDPWKAIVVEAIITFFFVVTILAVTNGNYGTAAPFIIALALGLAVMFGYNLTGGSANPFRSLAPAIYSGNTKNLYIYFIGPIIGACLAFFAVYIYYLFSGKSGKREAKVE